MTNMEDIKSRPLGSINDFIELHNENMHVINGVFNKLIASCNRQNGAIFRLTLLTLAVATAGYWMSTRIDRLEQKVAGLQDIIKINNETEEK